MQRSKFTLALMAFLLLIGAGVYAMHASKHAKNFDTQIWDYNGVKGGEANASSYTLGTTTPSHTTCGIVDSTICQIVAEPDPSNPNQPDLSGQNPMEHQLEFQATLRGKN